MVQVTVSIAAIAYVQSCNAYFEAIQQQRLFCLMPAWAVHQDNTAAMACWKKKTR